MRVKFISSTSVSLCCAHNSVCADNKAIVPVWIYRLQSWPVTKTRCFHLMKLLRKIMWQLTDDLAISSRRSLSHSVQSNTRNLHASLYIKLYTSEFTKPCERGTASSPCSVHEALRWRQFVALVLKVGEFFALPSSHLGFCLGAGTCKLTIYF